ncbi:uncharacterized protein LOC124158684 isoform X2 [Ischnura elegans]|uniref:uncharacterized protein LOC124158684 isoform X2 n=1 Tax=Ischnura elegans TaxID=197161 RepID=UPI001ED86BD2|nr:uncharacterized protein LOC124158684 isoform X2 [Ischnura elegans]
MEVVQGGGPLVCGPRATPSSTHPPLRLGHHHHHHRLEADGPASAALHVQTEEGGGGLDPSWWRISASGSWDGGERKMRYGKLIDDRPTGSIPGAVQRRKLELLETHAPGASMRVVHSQSHASWRQDGGDLSSGGLSSSTASRSLVSTSSSTRVTSYRQWSSNFSQTTSNVAASKQETTLPAVTEFGNLELALNPLDVSFLRTRGNVGRSGSIGSRRPPTRSRRLSSGAPSPDSQADSNPTSPEAKSPQSDIASDNNSSSPGDSPDDRRDNERRKSLDDSATSPVSESIRESVSRLMALGWHPPGAAMPPLPPLSPLRTNFSASTPLHRKRSVSSEELRSPDGGEGSDPEGDGLKWERGASVRRSLPSSEWRSAVGPAVDGGASRLLRLRDPLKSSSVPALGGPAATNRKGSLVTAESLREMKGRLKHRGSVELVPQDEGMTQSMSNGTESARKVELNSKEGPKVSLRAAKEDSIVRDDRRKSWSVGYRNVEKREVVNGDDNSGFASRRRSYVVEPTRKEELRSEEGPKVSLRAAKEDSVVQDDRRKSWSMGCRNVEKREVVNGEEDSGFANRRRSYAFEFSDDSKQSPSSPVKKDTDWLQLQNGEREEVGHRIMLKAITSDTSDFVQNRVNEMLKKWSALTGGSYEGDLNYRRASSSSPIMRRQEGRWSPAKNSSTTWLDHGDGSRSENGGDVERNGFSRPATTISGARTTLRLTHAKGHSSFEKETVSGTSRPLEKVLAIMDELPPSSSGHLVEDYSFPRGLSPVDWSDGDTSGILSIKEPLNKPELTTPATSAGISVTFSNSDGGDSHSSTSTRHHSVTHLESKEVDGTRTEGGLKVRTSKKVEFSKTEVHFAAESGRFHIVETAGKPPPSNNFRRRRRSPTGTLNVDSSAAGARAMLLGGPSALTNGMRFGDSPYEKRLLAGTDGAADSMPTSENEREFGVEVLEEKQLTTNGDNHYEYGFTSSRTFEDLETKEEETKSSLEKMQDVDMTSSTVNFRHMISEDTTEKPRGILRVNPATSSNPSSWKPLLKMDDESDDSSKPKFGGVRLRPVVSPELHSRINLSSLESSDSSRILSTEKSQSSPLSPGQMELQKLLKSLRPVSVTPYADNFQESNDELGTQVANGGGMEVRITSASQTAVANSVIIGGDTSTEVLTPLSVAQRVREVEERRQRELREKLTANQKARTPGQFSTRVTLGPGSSSVVSVEPQVLSNKSIPPTLNSSPPSPKLTAKISAQSKISRIQTSPGDTSGFASDNVQHNLFDTKASTENCSRSEHIEEAPRIACIALGPQTRTKGVRESKEAFTTKEDLSTGPTPSDAGHCNKIFSALCVSRDDEAIRTKNVKNEGVKLFTSTVEKTPEDPSHLRHREYKSASPSKQMTSSWPVGNSKITKEDTKSRSENLSSKDSFKSTRKVKEVNTTSESQKKSQYSIMRSPPPQTKIFSGLFGGSPAYEKSVKATEVAEGMDPGYSVKLNVIEKRSEEVGPHSKTSKSEQPQRRSSLEEKSKKVEVTRSTTVGGSQVPKSPRLTETSRLSQLRQSSTSTTTSARPASPRLSPVVGDSGGSPSTGRAVRKRVRRRASGGGTDAIEDKRRGRKASTGGEEVSEESAILAELTRAADEILHAVNGYSDDPTSDEDAAKASAAAARSKRRTARVQHSKKSSSSSSNAVTTTKEVAKSTSSAAQRSTLTRTRSGGKENAASPAKERSQVKEVASSHEVKGSGANVKGQSSTANAGSPSGSPQVSLSTRGTALSSSFSEKEKAGRSKLQQHQGSGSPRTRSAMTRVEPTNRVAEVKLIEKRPPLPPGGQRRGKDGLKERTEVHTRTSHGKTKSAASSNLSNGESEVKKSETKRTINIARALEAVMPDPRNKTRKVEKKTDEHSKKETQVLRPASPQLSPRISLSLERKKVASSREGDKTSRRGIPT